MKISIIVPAHNEEGNIAYVAEKIEEMRKRSGLDIETILVDDHSIDNTGKVADKLSRDNTWIKVIHRKTGKKGFGAALIDGTNLSRGDVVVWLMGDRSDNPDDVPRMIEKLNQGYDIVYGTRFMSGSTIRGYPKVKLISNRIFNNFLRLIFLMPERDITNAFKAFRREVFTKVGPLKCMDFDITVELPLKAKRAGFKSGQAPVSWNGRTHGVSNLSLWKTAHKYLRTSIRIWFGPA
jgi:glycosyltransferase involved in cell wall biosynthesis